jgi:hypothetical protein
MNYYLDTEFHEYFKQPRLLGFKVGKSIPTIDLISIGIVSDDGREYYAVSRDFDVKAAWSDAWLRDNVLCPIYDEFTGMGDAPFGLPYLMEVVEEFGKTRAQIAEGIVSFVGKDMKPNFHAYYGSYDWVVTCWIFGRMINLPERFPMLPTDLKQMMNERGLTDDWKNLVCPQAAGKHNALEDAKWNKELHEAILRTSK